MTYEDVLKQIQDAGMMGNFSQYDLDTARRDPAFGATMLSYKKDWLSAGDDAARREINQKAEALRKQYGSYYGGTDGSKYYGLGQTPGSYQSAYQNRIDEALAGLGGKTAHQDRISGILDRMEGYGDFDYGPPPTYANRYQRELDELLGEVQNYGPFAWSKEEDPAYSAYAKQYRREGERATANALAQAASATGGQVSTAAMTAASQAGDYYAGKLSDKIPELYENAYQRYLSQYQMLADQLGQTRTAEQSDYAKYLDQLGQYNTDRAQSYDQWLQGYNMLGSTLGAMQGQDQTEWDRRMDTLGALQGQDGTAYSRYLDQVNYQAQQDALAREKAAQQQSLYQQQLDAILAAGGSPSAGMIAGSGYQNEYVQAMENYYRQQAAAGSGGGRTSGSTGSGTTGGTMDYDGLFKAALESGNPQSFLSNNYKKYGFTNSGGLWNDYKIWAEGQKDDPVSAFKGGDWSDGVIAQLLAMGYTQADLEDAGYTGGYFSKGTAGNGVDWRGIPMEYSPDRQKAGKTMGQDDFRGMQRTLEVMLGNGNEARAGEVIESVWSRLDGAQRGIVQQLLKKRGYGVEE